MSVISRIIPNTILTNNGVVVKANVSGVSYNSSFGEFLDGQIESLRSYVLRGGVFGSYFGWSDEAFAANGTVLTDDTMTGSSFSRASVSGTLEQEDGGNGTYAIDEFAYSYHEGLNTGILISGPETESPLVLNFSKNDYRVGDTVFDTFGGVTGYLVSGGVNGTVIRDGNVVPTSAPRIDDNGLVVESSATEILTYSADFSDSSWLVESGVTRGTTVTGPVQGYSAQRFNYTSGNGRVQKTVSITDNRHTVFAIARPISPFNYICVRLPLGAGGAWVTLAIDFDDLSVAQSSQHHSNITVTALDDGYALIRFEFVSETEPTLPFFIFGTDSIGVNAGNFSAPSQAGAYDIALFSTQEGVSVTPIINGETLLTRSADNISIDLDLQWALKDAVTALDVGAYGAGSVAESTVLDDDFSGYADQAAAEAAGYTRFAATFNAAGDSWDYPGTDGARVTVHGATAGLVDGDVYELVAAVSGATKGTLRLTNGSVNYVEVPPSASVIRGVITYQTGQEIRLQAAGGANAYNGTIDSITIRRVIPDRSDAGNAAVIKGTLTAAEVATGSDLLALSGFSASNYLEIPHSSDLDFGTGDWAIPFAFNSTNTVGSDYIFSMRAALAARAFINLYVSATGKPTLDVSDDSGVTLDRAESAQSFTDGQWHTGFALRRGSNLELWVDGALVAQRAIVNASGSLTNASAGFMIGVQADGPGSAAAAFNAGSITLPRIIKGRAPTAREIEVLYAYERTLFEADATLPGWAVYPGAQAWDNCGGLNPQDGFTVVAGFRAETPATNFSRVYEFSDLIVDNAANAFVRSGTPTTGAAVFSGDVNQGSLTGVEISTVALNRIATRYEQDNLGHSTNGSLVAKDTSVRMPISLPHLYLASNLTGSALLPCVLEYLTIIPYPVSDEELQLLSSENSPI